MHYLKNGDTLSAFGMTKRSDEWIMDNIASSRTSMYYLKNGDTLSAFGMTKRSE